MFGALALTTGGSAVGQQGGAQEFRASVIDLSATVQDITVPLNGSVTVETTVEVIRADIVSKDVADVRILSPKRVLIVGRDFGTTSVVLLGADTQQYVFEVSVELDLRRLNEAIRNIDPQSDARASAIYNHIILAGTVSSAERATRVAELANLFLPVPKSGQPAPTLQNHLEVAGEQQVLLRCVVAEVNRSAARKLGINGFLVGKNASDVFLINQIGGLNPADIGAAGSFPLFAPSAPLDQLFVTAQGGIPVSPFSTLSLGFPKIQMQTFIRALADNALLKILAEPNLVTISGETATFLAGGEFPVPVPQGFQTVTIEYREFGVRLNFTPVVRGHQRIRLRVAPEVSELDFSNGVQLEGFVIPGLTSRAVETTVELGSGETIAIAGLLSERVRGFATRVPGIGDVPILGALFRSVDYQRSLTELVILVTPEIVAPLDAHQKVALPGEGMTDPTDFELYMLGLLDGPYAGAGNLPEGGPDTGIESEPDELSVHGPWGHAGPTDMR
jgi:pilus assembly protein CpaC